MKNLTSALIVTALAATSFAGSTASSFAKEHGAPVRGPISGEKHKPSRGKVKPSQPATQVSTIARTGENGRKNNKGNQGKGKKKPLPMPAPTAARG